MPIALPPARPQPEQGSTTGRRWKVSSSARRYYLYRKDRRYWYETRPNLRRTVEERAQQLAEDEVEMELERRIREVTRRERGDFKGVHPCPTTSADVPDEQEVRLIVLGQAHTHKGGDQASAALEAMGDLLTNRRNSPRQTRNMLAFLAPNRGGMEGLRQEARYFLAWQSVVRDQAALNLDEHQRREADQSQRQSDETVRLRLGEAYRWLLVPPQQVENAASVSWNGTSAKPPATATRSSPARRGACARAST